MNVHVGFASDPDDMQGLAHFTEHMMLQGSSKYPIDSSFKDFIQQHGGKYIAFTQDDDTTYFYDIIPEHFVNSLDRYCLIIDFLLKNYRFSD